jgi:hypothetical protein
VWVIGRKRTVSIVVKTYRSHESFWIWEVYIFFSILVCLVKKNSDLGLCAGYVRS